MEWRAGAERRQGVRQRGGRCGTRRRRDTARAPSHSCDVAHAGRHDMWEAAGYLGMTVEMLSQRYGHHHPDHLSGAKRAFTRHRKTRSCGVTCGELESKLAKYWSEWQDLNLRPPRPERGALPDCASLRQATAIIRSASGLQAPAVSRYSTFRGPAPAHRRHPGRHHPFSFSTLAAQSCAMRVLGRRTCLRRYSLSCVPRLAKSDTFAAGPALFDEFQCRQLQNHVVSRFVGERNWNFPVNDLELGGWLRPQPWMPRPNRGRPKVLATNRDG